MNDDDELSALFAELPDDERAAILDALSLEVATPRDGARERLLHAVRAPERRWAPLLGELARFFDLGEAAVEIVLDRAALAVEWVATPFSGVRALHLEGGPALAAADAGLLWVEAGTRFPRHRHLGDEHVLVLEGSLTRDDGNRLGPGDVELMPEGSTHAYTAGSDGPLVYATVLFGGIEVVGP